MAKFKTIESLMNAAKAAGLRVKKTTSSDFNTYYQVIHKDDGIVGFFNTASGKKGADDKLTAGGEISSEHLQTPASK